MISPESIFYPMAIGDMITLSNHIITLIDFITLITQNILISLITLIPLITLITLVPLIFLMAIGSLFQSSYILTFGHV